MITKKSIRALTEKSKTNYDIDSDSSDSDDNIVLSQVKSVSIKDKNKRGRRRDHCVVFNGKYCIRNQECYQVFLPEMFLGVFEFFIFVVK